MDLLSGECHRTPSTGLVPSGNKPLPKRMLTHDLCRHLAWLGHNELMICFSACHTAFSSPCSVIYVFREADQTQFASTPNKPQSKYRSINELRCHKLSQSVIFHHMSSNITTPLELTQCYQEHIIVLIPMKYSAMPLQCGQISTNRSINTSIMWVEQPQNQSWVAASIW